MDGRDSKTFAAWDRQICEHQQEWSILTMSTIKDISSKYWNIWDSTMDHRNPKSRQAKWSSLTKTFLLCLSPILTGFMGRKSKWQVANLEIANLKLFCSKGPIAVGKSDQWEEQSYLSLKAKWSSCRLERVYIDAGEGKKSGLTML